VIRFSHLERVRREDFVVSTCLRLLAYVSHIDRSKPIWSTSPQVSAHYNAIKSWVAMADSAAETYKAAPAPIDFATAKTKVRDASLVTMLEDFYKVSKPAPETYEFASEEQEQMDFHLQFLQELDTFHKEALPILEKELSFQEANRTTTETTMFDMKVNYPNIHEEIEDEIERREWFKDTPYDKNKSN
jgi:hypothetical protein